MTPAPASMAPRATGRPVQQDVEERRTLGRFVHAIEDHGYGAAAELEYSHRNAVHVPEHDAKADAAVEAIQRGDDAAIEALESLARSTDLTRQDARLVLHALTILRSNRPHFKAYALHDDCEDRGYGAVFYHDARALVEVKAVNGLCELATTGHQRYRPARRPTEATQTAMEMGE